MKAFDLKRFSRLFVADGRATAKQSLLLLGVGLLLGLAYLLFCLSEQRPIYDFDIIMAFSFFVICVLQGFYTSLQWQDLTSRKRKAALLLQPVSKAERFTVKTIYCFVCFPLLCIGLMFLILWMGEGVNSRLMDAATFEKEGRFLFTGGIKDLLGTGLRIYALLASIYWAGSFFLKKWAPFKAIILMLAFFLLFSVMGACYFDFISEGFKSTFVLLFTVAAKYGDGNAIVWNAPSQLGKCLFIGLAVYLYVLSIYKFKETTL